MANQCKLLGFEEYDTAEVTQSIWYASAYSYVGIFQHSLIYVPDTVLPIDNTATFSPYQEFKEHPEVLAKAKKIYLYPSCTISRALTSSKYKKCLNPWLADAVVIPSLKDVGSLQTCTIAAFLIESTNQLLLLPVFNTQKENFEFAEGKPLQAFCAHDINSFCWSRNIPNVSEAKLVYYGEVYCVQPKDSYLVDLLTKNVPLNKLVFEDTVLKQLGNESNKLTCESLLSVRDMLDSTDPDTITAALKSLAMMDYIHYPNSTVFVLANSEHRWIYNKAVHASAVKFMLSQLGGPARRVMRGTYTDQITLQDYTLFQELLQSECTKTGDNPWDTLKQMPFMSTDNAVLIPQLID